MIRVYDKEPYVKGTLKLSFTERTVLLKYIKIW